MAKEIYALKISLFARQINIPSRDLKGVKKVSEFVSLVYVQFWHEAMISRWAPRNDLEMLQLLNSYPDADVKKSAIMVAKRFLWYLSEINIGLAYFDERITEDVKEKMMKNLEKPAKKKEMKRLEGKNLGFEDKDLSHFVTSKTKAFLELFGIPMQTNTLVILFEVLLTR